MEPTVAPVTAPTTSPSSGGGLTLAQVQAMGGNVSQSGQSQSIPSTGDSFEDSLLAGGSQSNNGTPSVPGKGLTLAQVQAMGGIVPAGSGDAPGSLAQYQAQSANPASIASNPDPSLWDKILSGTPADPVTTDETSGGGGGVGGGLKLIGSLFENSISDIPAVASGVVQLLDPFKWSSILTGLVKGAANITGETAGAIGDGLTTGNWSRLGTDVQKAEITIGNHPLQSVLALDGAFDATSAAVGAARDGLAVASDPSLNFKDTPTGQSLDRAVTKIQATKANIANLFAHQTTLSEHAAQLADFSKKLSDATNDYTTRQNTLESIKQQFSDAQDKLADAKAQLEGSIGDDKIAKQQQLDAAQAELDKATQDHLTAQKDLQVSADNRTKILDQIENETHQEAANQKAEAASKSGLGNQEDNLEGAVANHVSKSLQDQSELYNQNLGNTKISSDTIIKGLEDYKDKLRDSSKRDSVPLAQAAIDELKLRDIVNSASNDQDLYKKLNESGVDPKKWENLNPDQLRKEYTPLTSENFKQVRNSLYDGISRKANETSEYQYNSTVKPAFDKAFGDAIKDQYGPERLDTIKQIDKAWANLKNNPLFKDGATVTLDKITKDWNNFARSVGKTPGGDALIEQVRNFAAERVMTNAEDGLKPGTFDYNKIVKGVDKYGNVLGQTLSDRLLQTAQDYKTLEDRRALNDQAIKERSKALKDSLSEKKSDINAKRQSIVKETNENIAKKTEAIKNITASASKIAKDAKDIGADKPDFIRNVSAIDSPEKLNAFLDKTGTKSAQEVGHVILQKELSPIADSIQNGTFDPKMIGDALDKLDKIGKGDASVRSALLGDSEADLKNLREKYDEWEEKNEKSAKDLTPEERLKKAASGGLVLALLPFGKFYGFRQILSAITPGEETLDSLGERFSKAGKIIGSVPKVATAEAGTVAHIGKQEDK